MLLDPDKTMPTPTHPDAIGHLNELVDRNGKAWFSALAERAIRTGEDSIPDEELDQVVGLLREDAIATRRSGALTSMTVTATGTTLGSIEWLGAFDNFKLLPSTLRLQPNPKATIVFGKNGSGKSSLCDAIKALAMPEQHERPFGNVRRPSGNRPSFEVKMAGVACPTKWIDGRDQLGSMAGSITYFDTAIAARNIRVPVAPERIVSLAPFRLGVFDVLRAYIGRLGSELKMRHTAAEAAKKTSLARLQAALGAFPGSPFKIPATIGRSEVEAALRTAGSPPSPESLVTKRQEVDDLTKACSADGTKALQAEIRDLERLGQALKLLQGEISTLWAMQPGSKTIRHMAVIRERQTLAASVVPKGVDVQEFLDVVAAAGHFCDLEGATVATTCPLCRQPIGSAGEALFRAYRKVLDDALEVERKQLAGALEKAKRLSEAIPAIITGDLSTTAIEEVLRTRAITAMARIVAHAKADSDPSSEASTTMAELSTVAALVTDMLAAKQATARAAESGSSEPLRKLDIAKRQLYELEYAAILVNSAVDLGLVLTAISDEEWLRHVIPTMKTVSTQVSNTRRDAHSNLVLDTFNARLDQEYQKLSNKPMAHFGAVMVPKTTARGEDAEIAMDTLIGPTGSQQKLANVMSEGEQRMHALALFFAELECSTHSVIVFDDPVSSFDFDHIENYCIRLRDFVTKHPTRQVIVLTHNWEFFVRLQDKLDMHDPSILVLEQCSVVSSYVEKVDQLSREIQSLTGGTGFFSDGDKRTVSSAMRLLIEVVVNKTVFNDQRHRYRQPNRQPVSSFRNYVKLVPLEPNEATRLSDLYSILSQSEHDDPRNNILTIDRVSYKAHFDEIRSIEAALKARKALRP